MTFKDLLAELQKMTPDELEKELIFRESYDDGQCHEISLYRASGAIPFAWGSPMDDDENIAVDAGDWFFA